MTTATIASGDPVLPSEWSPDPHTLAALAEAFPEVDVADLLVSYRRRCTGRRRSEVGRNYGSNASSWTLAFCRYVRVIWSIETEFAGKEREHVAVEASTVRTRGHLRLLRTA